jgi:two-component system, NtrC family, sensor histidine kinase HydH
MGYFPQKTPTTEGVCVILVSMKDKTQLSGEFRLTRRFAIASFGVIVVIAVGLSWLLSNMLTDRLLKREGAVMEDFMQLILRTEDAEAYFIDPKNPELRLRFLKAMKHVDDITEPVRVNAYSPDGTVLWSTDKTLVGRRFPVNDELEEAMRGQTVVSSGNARFGLPDKEEHEGLAIYGSNFVESYIPISEQADGKVLGVMEFYKIPLQLNESIREGIVRLWLACLASAILLFTTLYWIVSRADRVMREQQVRLAEAATLATAVELASAVAHNLRNPLASIRVSAEMQQQPDVPLPEVVEHSQDITTAVDRADRWISELVRVSQVHHLTPEPVPVALLMQGCLREMQPEFKRCGIDLQVADGPDVHVVAHPAMLRQIILSVIANAVDAMGQGGELKVSWQQQERVAILRLSDNGTGVSEEVRQRLFRPFFSTKSGGMGIGLALVKRMVEQWRGSVELIAVAPHGTAVEIRLPVAAAS